MDVVTPDGLPTPDVGPWCKRKYHFLRRYLELFTTGMKHKWPERHYIDLFAGAGIVRLRGSDELVLGSPMVAASMRDPFTKLHLCERDERLASALSARLGPRYPADRVVITGGDANDRIETILANVPDRDALVVTFADPFGLHLDFSTVAAVSRKRSDLIILLADNMDAMRNWAPYYYDNPESSLDRFFGNGTWRELLATGKGTAERLREGYREQLRTLGYEFFGLEHIQNASGRDIYSLLYASRNNRGLDFWTKASQVDEGGQRSLPF